MFCKYFGIQFNSILKIGLFSLRMSSKYNHLRTRMAVSLLLLRTGSCGRELCVPIRLVSISMHCIIMRRLGVTS